MSPRLTAAPAAALACALGAGLLLAPSPALAAPDAAPAVPAAPAAPPAAPAAADSAAAPAAAAPTVSPAEALAPTVVTVAVPEVSDRARYVLGQPGPISATVRVTEAGSAELRGSVAFFDGDVLLGTAPVVPDASAAAAGSVTVRIDTDRWPAGGAREVVAVFTPEEGSGSAPARSASRTYRVVDTRRTVPDIALSGAPAASIADAELDWTIGNIWFSNFRVGFEREILGGDVTLPALTNPGPAASDAELQAYFFRPFTFAGGSGARDATGARVLDFDGAVRLTSGSGNRWDFSAPRVHLGADGAGYITASFSGFYAAGASRQDYPEARVTIATFTGAELSEPGPDGIVSATIPLAWAGQAAGAGTWFYDYEDSFPNEFVALLNPLVAPFFARSAVATDDSKIPHPITLRFVETVVDAGTDPGTDPGTEPGTDPGTEPGTDPGTDPGTGPGSEPETDPGTDPETNPGTDPGPGTGPGERPGPGTDPAPGTAAGAPAPGAHALAHTGADGGLGAALGAVLAALGGTAIALLGARRARRR